MYKKVKWRFSFRKTQTTLKINKRHAQWKKILIPKQRIFSLW